MDPTWWWLAIASMIVVDVLAFWLGYHWHRYLSARREKPSIDASELKQQIDEFDSALEGINQSLQTVDRTMEHLHAVEPDKEKDSEQLARQEAIRIAEKLAANGASKTAIERTCGLTPGEATMIHRMHKPRATA